MSLIHKITSLECTVGVVGLGYVGLPLVLAYAAKGYHTIGFDIDPSKIEALTEGKSYIKHIPTDQVADKWAVAF
jgi:UDP-N-acetyl-D-glucosamine dehydrogenase